MSDSLDESERDRYFRSLMLEFIDDLTQQTFLESRVLVAGAGGLGSAIIQYLAAAGVGTIGIVDNGTVTRSNRQRQVIHGVDDVGEPKVESAARAVGILNPDVAVEKHRTRIDTDVDEWLLEAYDVVVDGLDNFAARLILNDVTALSDIPFVHGAVFGVEGQTTTFLPDGPWYRCLVLEVPESGAISSDEPVGVLPPLPGIIGCLQATETLELLADFGHPLTDLLRFDSIDFEFVRTPIQQDPNCPICGSDGIESFDQVAYDRRYRIRE